MMANMNLSLSILMAKQQLYDSTLSGISGIMRSIQIQKIQFEISQQSVSKSPGTIGKY
jgi:hypothetical protein